jgi:hypothetical protein
MERETTKRAKEKSEQFTYEKNSVYPIKMPYRLGHSLWHTFSLRKWGKAYFWLSAIK